MVSTDYAFRHVELALEAIKGDASALDRMDISADGFWRSFTAIIFSLPALIFMWALGARSPDHPGVVFSPALRFAVDAMLDIGMWLALAAIMILVLRAISFDRRTAHFIIARNWTTLFFNYVAALAFVPELFFGGESALFGFIVFTVLVVMIAAFIRITKQALQCNVLVAIGLVLAELFCMLVVSSAIYPSM